MDPQSYKNFKKANPNLEPDAEDVAIFNGQDPNTPRYNRESGLLTDYGRSLGMKEVNKPNSVITSDSLLANDNPVPLPEKNVPTYGGIPGATDAMVKSNEKTASELTAEESKKKSDTDAAKYLEEIVGSGKISSSIDYTDVDKTKKEKSRLDAQLLSEQTANRRAVENIRKTFRGSPAGLADAINSENRQSFAKQADISLLKFVADNDYQGAKDVADRALAMKLEESKADLEGLKFLAERSDDIADRDFTVALNEKIKKDEAKLKKEETLETDLNKIKIEAAKNGLKDLTALSGAKTIDEALQIAGSYLTSPKEKLEIEKLTGDIAKNTMELLAAKQTLGGSTGDPVLDIVSASAKYGDKRLTDSQLEKIQKATQALGGMETLQGLLVQGKDGLKLSGPLSGRVRTLFSQLGGDADAKAINATIQGLIPTVARGIFGEVGVLTKDDIENYRATVPNLTSTEAQNKLVSIIMYDVLSRSLESTLVTNAQNQTNVSGFVSTYKDAKSRIGALKSELGVVEETPVDPINDAKMEAGWTTQFGAENIKSSLDSFFQ